MKNLMIRLKLVLLLCLGTSLTLQSQDTRVLFLGNSYTYSNQMPEILVSIADNMSHDLFMNANTPGGFTLEGHTTNMTSTDLIEEANWDFVVLQEQSQLPSFSEAQVASQSLPYASELNTLIEQHNPCGETMFYMTWGRENGDAQNCENWPPVCTYEGMDDLLANSYMTMAETNNAVVSPVGRVWRWIRENHPEVDLYAGDGSHPSLTGSYAAAVCFFVAIYRENPELITFNSSLSEADATIIKEAVKLVVFDELEEWQIGEFDLTAEFEVVINDDTGNAQLINLSQNATSYIWTINGVEYTSENVLYEANYDPFEVSLSTSNDCESVTSGSSLVDFTNGIYDIVNARIRVYPNPAEGVVTFSQLVSSVRVYDSLGRLVYNEPNRTNSIDISDLRTGYYQVTFVTSDGQQLKETIKRI